MWNVQSFLKTFLCSAVASLVPVHILHLGDLLFQDKMKELSVKCKRIKQERRLVNAELCLRNKEWNRTDQTFSLGWTTLVLVICCWRFDIGQLYQPLPKNIRKKGCRLSVGQTSGRYRMAFLVCVWCDLVRMGTSENTLVPQATWPVYFLLTFKFHFSNWCAPLAHKLPKERT